MTHWNRSMMVLNGVEAEVRTDGKVWQRNTTKTIYCPLYISLETFKKDLDRAADGLEETLLHTVPELYGEPAEIRITGWRDFTAKEMDSLPGNS